MNEWKKRAKDSSPVETVNKIENILSNMGFKPNYEEYDSDVLGLCSSRVSIKIGSHISIGTNGKGSTKEFTKASAYAELMERIQNLAFIPIPFLWGKNFSEKFSEVNLMVNSIDNEFADKNSYLSKFCDRIASSLPFYVFSKEKALEVVINSLKECSIVKDHVILDTFYEYKSKKEIKFPVKDFYFLYGSNGMASGNTLEEAIVQACCEIFERYSQNKFLNGEVSFPDIPKEDYSKFEQINDIVNHIEHEGYKVIIKDASMGGKYPVVLTAIINPKTGLASFKFGSHPSMEIALERTFTETIQGRTKLLSSIGNEVVYNRKDDEAKTNSFNATKRGISPLPIETFINKPTYEYKKWGIDKSLDNKEMAKYLLDVFVKDGYNPLISDESWLGFPTVFIVVPFFSEARDFSYIAIKEELSNIKFAKAFRHLNNINDEHVNALINHAMLVRRSFIVNEPYPSTMIFVEKMNEHNAFMDYVLSCCYYYQNDINNAYKFMNIAKKENIDDIVVTASDKYLEGRINGYNHDESMKAIKLLFTEDVACRIDGIYNDPKKIFEKAFPVCNDEKCDNCKLVCDNKAVDDFYIRLLKTRQDANLGIKNLQKLFD